MNKILTFTILTIVIFGYFVFQRVNAPDSSSDKAIISDNIASEGDGSDSLKVEPLVLDNQTIDFPHTDDNINESIIIRSDKDLYTSFAGSDVYFSVTNTSDTEEDGILLFHFDQNFKKSEDDPSGISKPRVQFLEQRLDNNWSRQKLIYNNISINSTKLAQALEKKKDIPETFDVSAGTQFKLAFHQTAYFKAKISYPPGSEGEFWIETLGENGGYGLLDPWYASTYTHRKKITVDNAMVSGGADLTNFPVLVSLNNDLSLKGTAFGGKVASGAGEFVFTSSDGTTKLDHEVEYYSSLDGKIVAWVEVPTLATASDTILYLYFGGPTTGATNQNPTGVWDANYLGVWHLGEDVKDEQTTGIHYDSTSNNNDATQNNNSKANGQIGYAQIFDGTSDWIKITSFQNGSSITDYTISLWISSSAGAVDAAAAISESGGSQYESGIRMNLDNTFNALHNSANGAGLFSTTSAISDNNWTYLTTRRSGSTVNAYLDGVVDATSATNSTTLAWTGCVRFGVAFTTNACPEATALTGYLDEIRFSADDRSAAWIATEYNNQNSPSTYVTTTGAEKEIRTAPDVKFRGGGEIKGGVEIK